MIDRDGSPDLGELAASARRLREIAGSLREKADRAERLLDAPRTLDTREAWRGGYPDQVRGTLGLLDEWVVSSVLAIRERADHLESVATDYELTAEVGRLARTMGAVGSR